MRALLHTTFTSCNGWLRLLHTAYTAACQQVDSKKGQTSDIYSLKNSFEGIIRCLKAKGQ